MRLVSLLDAWLPTLVALVTLIAVYLRHRKKPVGLAGWSLPLAAGLLVAILPGIMALVGVQLDAISPENRHRVGGKFLSEGVEHIVAGLYSTVAAGVAGVWLLPRREDAASVPWKSIIGVVLLSIAALIGGYLVALSGAAYTFIHGFFAIIVVAHVGLMRLSNSNASRERAAIGAGLAVSAVVAWGVAMLLTVAALRWSNLALATVENMARHAFLHVHLGRLVPWVVLPSFGIFGVSLLQYFVRLRGEVGDSPDGTAKRATATFVVALLVGIAAGGFAMQYRDLAAQTEHAEEVFRNPLAFVGDVTLPTSTSGLLTEETILIKLGRDSTVVSKALQTEGAVDFEPENSGKSPLKLDGPEELRNALEDVVATKKREAELLGTPFDALATVAADRCTPAHRVIDSMVTASRAGLYRFKLGVESPEGESRAINTSAPVAYNPKAEDGDLALHDKFHLTSDGVVAYFAGRPVAPVAGCPKDGPTLCVEVARDGECGARYDWARLRELTVAEHRSAPSGTFLLVVGEEVPWQSAVDLMDALRWKDPDGERRSDNELLPDVVLFDGIAPPPHPAGSSEPSPATDGDPGLAPHRRNTLGGDHEGPPPTFDISAD